MRKDKEVPSEDEEGMELVEEFADEAYVLEVVLNWMCAALGLKPRMPMHNIVGVIFYYLAKGGENEKIPGHE